MKNPKCEDCLLGTKCTTFNNQEGFGNPDAPLVIVLDEPGNLQGEKLLIWLTKRLGLTGNDIWVDYLLRCPLLDGDKKKNIHQRYRICWTSHPRTRIENAKVLVIAGNWAADFLIDAKMKEWNGKKHPESGAWVIYGFPYLLMNPATCVDSWRVLFKAAEEAGLKPKMVIDVEPFKFPTRQLI